ncbi:MAG TPA: hypothetical protein VMS77_06010 [Conexivisphaerales archaeon]|nr:hypothetical protein [Conexivisphaerales archaeon]
MSLARRTALSALGALLLGLVVTASFVFFVSPRGGPMSVIPSVTGYLVSVDEAVKIARANGLGISLPSQVPEGVELKAVLVNPMSSGDSFATEAQLNLLYGFPHQDYPNGTVASRWIGEIGRNATKYDFPFKPTEVPIIVTAYLRPSTPTPQVDANLTQWVDDLNDGPLGKVGLGKAWLTELSGGPAYVRTQTEGLLAISPSEQMWFPFTGEYIVMFLNTGSYSVASTLPLDETLAYASSFVQSGGA